MGNGRFYVNRYSLMKEIAELRSKLLDHLEKALLLSEETHERSSAI